MIRRVLIGLALAVVTVAVAGLLAFLYVMPPFFLTSPETFVKAMAAAAPTVDEVADPVERMLAERGRYLVQTAGCIGCHATNGPQGPDLTKYLAGGGMKFKSAHGTFVSRNLTTDEETGLGRRTDEEVKRVLRSGIMPERRVASYMMMPWGGFSNWTEEDRHAVVVYLRRLPPVRHAIPEAVLENSLDAPGALEEVYGLRDYGTKAP